MHYSKTTLAMALLASATLTACGGSSGGGSDPQPSTTQNFQEEFSMTTDRYDVVDGPAGFSIDSSTLAINTSETTDASFSAAVTTPNGNSVTPADYFGAVDPNAGSAWWDGWTIRDPDIEGNLPGSPTTFHPLQAEIQGGTITPAGTSNCAGIAGGLQDAGTVQEFGATFPVCVITDGDLDGDYTLSNDHIYLLDGTVQVGNGDVESASDASTVRQDVLTVEAGTQIFGITGTQPSLVITRGSQINANGSAAMPIIFGGVDADSSQTNWVAGPGTSNPDDDPAYLGGRGKWGSLILSGYGVVNNGNSADQTTTEAVPDGVTRWFGGTDNSDSSGTLSYIIVAESGIAFRPDEEVQGITMEGVGSGTTISHYQVTNSDDDGIEFFGGAANLDHYVANGVTDDSLDIDLGYQGTIQYALIRQGTQHGDRGIESDNNGSSFGATPKSAPIIANVTILGNAGNGGTSDQNTHAAMHREGFGGQVYRSVYADDSIAGGQFDLGCLDVDDELDDTLAYHDVLFNCAAGALLPADD